MKNTKKNLKLLFSSTALVAIVGSASSTVVSCGHKSSPPSPSTLWKNFKSAAKNQSTTDIVNSMKIISWVNNIYSDSDYTVDFEANDNSKQIVDTITNNVLKNNAVISINFSANHPTYNIKNWSIITLPENSKAIQWANIKRHTKNITAETLGNQAIKAKTAGWKTGDKAVFDTFSDGIMGDPEIKIDDTNFTLTGIISINKGSAARNSYGDVNPLYVTYRFEDQIPYNISNWLFDSSKKQRVSWKLFTNNANNYISDSANVINGNTIIKGLIDKLKAKHNWTDLNLIDVSDNQGTGEFGPQPGRPGVSPFYGWLLTFNKGPKSENRTMTLQAIFHNFNYPTKGGTPIGDGFDPADPNTWEVI